MFYEPKFFTRNVEQSNLQQALTHIDVSIEPFPWNPVLPMSSIISDVFPVKAFPGLPLCPLGPLSPGGPRLPALPM